jgi:hypothetical protein
MNGMAHRHNAAMAQKPELRLRIPSRPAAGEVFNLLELKAARTP